MGSEQGLFLTFSLDAYEHLDSLVITGPGLSLVRRLHLREPPYDGQNAFSDLQLGCGYHYTPWGTSSSDCDCMVGRTGEVHGELSLRWTFEADPAEALDVWPTPAVVSMYPSGGWTSEIHEQATYGDGVPAPLPDTTTLRYSATTPWGYLFLKRCYYGSCSYPQQGASVETAYRGLYQVHFAARNDEGAAPMCDVDVPVRVTGGGVSGETTVTIQGSGAAPSSDTLHVWTTPSSIAAGDSASVYARHHQAGCDSGRELPDSTQMTVMLFPSKGELVYEAERGVSVDVPYGDLKDGLVQYVAPADSVASDSTDCGTVWIGVMGGGREGQAAVEVVEPSARPLFPARALPPDVTRSDNASSCEGGYCAAAPEWSAVLRAQMLAQALEEDPHGLLDVPCEHLAAWAEVGAHELPLPVIDRMRELQESQSFWSTCLGSWHIQKLVNGVGPLVNMDYYPVRITLPDGVDADDYFEAVRQNLNDYLDQTLAHFQPYTGEEQRWIDGPVLGTVGHFDVSDVVWPFWPFTISANVEDMAVIASEYSPGPSAWRWRFTTVWSPEAFKHPVSGTREFGLVPNGDGSYTFYTRGVDRLASLDDMTQDLLLRYVLQRDAVPNVQFAGAAELWRGLQAEIYAEIISMGGEALIVQPVEYYADWEGFQDYFDGSISLAELLTEHGCEL